MEEEGRPLSPGLSREAGRTLGDAHVLSPSLIIADIFTEEREYRSATWRLSLLPGLRSRTCFSSIFKTGDLCCDSAF